MVAGIRQRNKTMQVDVNSILKAEDNSNVVLKFLYGKQWTETVLKSAAATMSLIPTA